MRLYHPADSGKKRLKSSHLPACIPERRADNGGKFPADISRFLPWQASAEDIAAWKLPPTDN